MEIKEGTGRRAIVGMEVKGKKNENEEEGRGQCGGKKVV